MKPNTAPIGVVKRGGPEMVYINDDSGQKNQSNFYTLTLKKPKCNQERNQKMDAVME